ncbi:MAG TPA: hypothetical protein VI316_07775 [Candidatus Dormibacteraeota bacterium]
MTDILDLVDVDRLRAEVQTKYREVADAPTAEYHFHTGRQHALRLGYRAAPLDQLPEEACEAFAGVANPFHWGPPQPSAGPVSSMSSSGRPSTPSRTPVVRSRRDASARTGTRFERVGRLDGRWTTPVRADLGRRPEPC